MRNQDGAHRLTKAPVHGNSKVKSRTLGFHDAHTSASPDVHANNVFIVPSMITPRPPWNGLNIPSEAYNYRLWCPFTNIKNPYFQNMAVPPPLLISQMHPPLSD
ncbi:hypothetical protein BV22DRAFT_1135903 [Leucogyrophana mollusca]|uniref:Uncharacterized protein n=1 Tax=Leucogyrophana mollusca TaxID=85980 RepID=A0ACB8AV98_9AGAM|nr:hypothetical protein BV22DRAFT_1135903 [Leucogyrophana mollusca]